MRTELTIYGFRDGVNCLHKLSRQLARFAGSGEELGRDLSRDRTIFLHQIERKLSLPTAKYQLRPDPGTRPFLLRPQFMSRNQQLVRVLDAERLDTYQRGREHNSVVTVARQRIRPHKPWQTLSALATEGDVMTKLFSPAAGFPPTQHVPFGRLLVFNRDVGTTVDPRLPKPLYRSEDYRVGKVGR